MSKVLLGDVAVEHKETCKGSKDGYPIVGLEHLIPEEITLTAWNEGSENTFSKMFRKGNVLFGRRRAYLKKAAVAPFDGICSGDITVIEAKPDRILPELLPFIIQNDDLFEFAVGKSAGSLSPRVKWEHLKNYEFELPDKPYMFSVMQTKTQWSQNTYMPYLKEADDDHLSRDEMGQYLVYDDVYIVCENNSYGVYRNDDDSLTDTVTISQNEAGIDTEDRIIKLKKYIANMK